MSSLTLQEREARYRAIVDSHHYERIFRVRVADYAMTFVNAAFCRLQGKPESDYLGRSFLDLLNSETAQQHFIQSVADVVAQRSSLTNEGAGQDLATGKPIWILRSFSPIIEADGSIAEIQVVSLDISDRKQAELELQTTNERLQQSNAELQQFAYIASHDLQTPLRAISGFAQLLQTEQRELLTEDGKDDLNRIISNVYQMQALINGLLAFSRVETQAKDFQPVSLQTLIASIAESLADELAQAGCALSWDSLPEVWGDRSQLNQLLQNLLSNALKYRSQAQAKIHVSAQRDATDQVSWIIAVRDNGIGIAERHQARIFQIFRRLHTQEEYAGTGIGLALCQRIVTRHDGKIWLTSEEGKGSTFYFTLHEREPNNE